jgi:hypothetical protein
MTQPYNRSFIPYTASSLSTLSHILTSSHQLSNTHLYLVYHQVVEEARTISGSELEGNDGVSKLFIWALTEE